MDVSPDTLRNYLARERLRDGSYLSIRAIRPEDKQALQDGLRRLSPQSAYFRFFRHKRELSPQELIYFTEIDFDTHVALVAVNEASGAPVGVGRYIVCQKAPQRIAEITLAVDDAFRGRGVATVLVQHLVKVARAAGVAEFRASVMAGNLHMLGVLLNLGLPLQRSREDAVVRIRLFLNAPAAP